MSSYFVNSLSGRYPNGPDYQLLNYGASSGAMNNGTYRDSTSATVHHATGSYGYSYNGMDLTVTNRGGGASSATNTGGHFGGGSVAGDTFSCLPAERGFRQSSNCYLASTAKSLLSPGCENSKLGSQRSSPHAEQPRSTNLSSPNLSSSSGGVSGTAQCLTEQDDTLPQTEEVQQNRNATLGSNSLPTTGHSQPVQKQESGPGGSADGSMGSEAQTPQIFPWMRKLHISHGTCCS